MKPRVTAEELLADPDLPADVRAVLEAERVRKVKPRPSGFYIVGQTKKGTNVQPGRRDFHE